MTPVVLGLVASVTSPAVAAPACGGMWVGGNSCVFEHVRDPIVVKGTAVAVGERGAFVTVTAYAILPFALVQVAQCSGQGALAAACAGVGASPFVNFPHVCRVTGHVQGTYACTSDP